VQQLIVVISCPHHLLELGPIRQPVEVSQRSWNLLRHQPQHVMPRSENRCQLLCHSSSAAQHSTFGADVRLPNTRRRPRPVPAGLRQCCAGRLTRLPVQPPAVGTQRCMTIHRWFVALGPHHRHTRQFPLVESTRACAVQAGDNRLPLAEWHSYIILGCRPATFV